MKAERTIECIGTTRNRNEPTKFDIRVRAGNETAFTYRISLDEAVQLRRELTDFLAGQNVTSNF
jgi:hypothetical protein